MAVEKMAATTRRRQTKKRRGFAEMPREPLAGEFSPDTRWADIVGSALLAEAGREGLLDGEKSQHVTFRAPPALLEAAKRNCGIDSTSELGMLALAMLARPDPVAAVMRRTRGALGEDHTLDD